MKCNVIEKGEVMKNILAVFAAALLLAVGSVYPAFATPLSMSLKDSPDLMAEYVTVDYRAATHSFTADGFVGTYHKDHTEIYDYFNSSLRLSALLDGDGKLLSGSLDIGNINGPTPLLTGNLIAFGFEEGGPTMQFLFDNLGGSLAADFGARAFLTLNFTGFENSANGFRSDFGNPFGSATADVEAPAVPEPSTVSLLLLGAGALVAARRRRSASAA